jgi:hypothetical protein
LLWKGGDRHDATECAACGEREERATRAGHPGLEWGFGHRGIEAERVPLGDARKKRPGAWQCLLLGRFRCAGRPWRCIPNVTPAESHPKRSSVPGQNG